GQEATEGAAGDLAALRKEVEELEIKALTRRRAQLQRELNGNQTAAFSQGLSDCCLLFPAGVHEAFLSCAGVESGQSARKRSRAYLIRDFVKPTPIKQPPNLSKISTGQWISDNAQILQRLIDDGSLIYLNDDGSVNTSELRGYLLYSQKIGELLDANYSPNVVWEFDEDYRKLMADGGANPAAVPSTPERSTQSEGISQPQAPVCLSFNSTAGCQRSSCRYRHVCKLPGCGKPHPAQLHRQSSDAAEGSTAYRH
uniref:C3H1-type domain-containing protein n=1 Tax=Macrostomum lignano TaxID=282301 RepID=A0A1I8I1E9_9PLAT